MRWRCPRESVPTRRSTNARASTRAQARSQRRGVVDAVEARRELDVLAPRELAVEQRLVRDPAELGPHAPRGRRRSGRTRRARTSAESRSRARRGACSCRRRSDPRARRSRRREAPRSRRAAPRRAPNVRVTASTTMRSIRASSRVPEPRSSREPVPVRASRSREPCDRRVGDRATSQRLATVLAESRDSRARERPGPRARAGRTRNLSAGPC